MFGRPFLTAIGAAAVEFERLLLSSFCFASPRSPGDINEAESRSEARFATASVLSREEGEVPFLLLRRFLRVPPMFIKDSMVLEGRHGSRTEARMAIDVKQSA